MKMGVGLFHIYWFQLFMSPLGPSKSWGVDTPNRCTYSGYSLHTHPVALTGVREGLTPSPSIPLGWPGPMGARTGGTQSTGELHARGREVPRTVQSPYKLHSSIPYGSTRLRL